MAIILNHTYRIVVGTTNSVHNGVNVLYMVPTVLIGVGFNEAQWASVLFNLYAPLYAALMTTPASVQYVSLQDITAVPSPTPTVSTNPSQAGTAGANPLPAQTSGVITLQTGFAGRGFRGRVYVPFPDQADSPNVPSPIPSAGYQTRLGFLAAHLINNENMTVLGNGYTIQHVLFHRKTKATTAIIAARDNPKWGTQRRRGTYRVAHR